MDTNVLSMGAPGRREGAAALADWLDVRSDELFLSTVTVTEIADGIAKLRRIGALARADHLDDWLDVVLHLYGDRVIPFDVPAARHAGLLMDRARATGQAPGFADLAIAATAGVHELTVLTRNIRHFAPLDIRVIDPFESLPD
ncbi:MAG: type II toxin-antitoxin system VapC family toxin [Rhodospirillaceae bacterium]|nr:type II toxin-antitoxin system VapC family toxin [Rhodospirillaceae bacterium]MDE0255315.1 type II toxin-antitoxin system VapC family toxin [Rhodospirillaceae bacterium]MDE0616204.1 type II toxin-antitoxin system VapC family toxin [Rhodospirillaceae bacterium]